MGQLYESPENRQKLVQALIVPRSYYNISIGRRADGLSKRAAKGALHLARGHPTCLHRRPSHTLVFLRLPEIVCMEIMKEAKDITGVAAVEAIRAHFPALERRHNGHPVAYFDGPGGTQVPRPVVEAMADYLYHQNANTHWAYPTSPETDAMLLAAREALADFVGAPGGAEEIAFGANMTTLTFHLARSVARGVHGRPL